MLPVFYRSTSYFPDQVHKTWVFLIHILDSYKNAKRVASPETSTPLLEIYVMYYRMYPVLQKRASCHLHMY